jgi:FKBP-type peptidyl-prolyl cis-trans isomerase
MNDTFLLACASCFFYSENGGKSFGEVPKNSTIIYEVDLVEVK